MVSGLAAVAVLLLCGLLLGVGCEVPLFDPSHRDGIIHDVFGDHPNRHPSGPRVPTSRRGVPVAGPHGVEIRGLAGRADLLAAATDRGVVVWMLPGGAVQHIDLEDGLPSLDVRSVAADVHGTDLFGATSVGLVRGGLHETWVIGETWPRVFRTCGPRPDGGCVAGGEKGRLAAWTHTRLDTLQLPALRARVVGIAHRAPIDATGSEKTAASALIPSFLPGLVVATQDHGLWILRSTGMRVRWLQIGRRDGLPEASLHAVAVDAQNCIWLATDAGVVCLEHLFRVHAWPEHPILGTPATALLCAPDGSLYFGCRAGLMRLDPRASFEASGPTVEWLRPGPVNALAWADGTVWWSDGVRVRSLDGRELRPSAPIPIVICPIWHASRRVAPASGSGAAAIPPGAAAVLQRFRMTTFGSEVLCAIRNQAGACGRGRAADSTRAYCKVALGIPGELDRGVGAGAQPDA